MEYWGVVKQMLRITPSLQRSNLSRRSFGEGGYSNNFGLRTSIKGLTFVWVIDEKDFMFHGRR